MSRKGDSFGPPRQRQYGSRSSDRFDRPTRAHALNVGQPLDLLHNLDANAQWQSWRGGARLASQQLGAFDDSWQPAMLLRSAPFTADGALTRTPVVQISFPSRNSPVGRWTVTVLPRGAERASVEITATGQQEVTATWSEVENGAWVERSWRLLRVASGPVWNELGGVGGDLIGELVEDSLLPRGGWAEDEEVVLRMVVAVAGTGNALYLDGERQWRRVPVRDAQGRVIRRRLVEERIPPEMPLALHSGRRLVQSTTLSCNCPSNLGVVLWDWRARASAIEEGGGRMGIRAVAGPLRPPVGTAGVDTEDPLLGLGRMQTVGRRFGELDWRRVPADGCKHCHAVRWALGCPCAEPPDPPSPINSYWTDAEKFERLEEFVVPMSQPGYGELLAAAGMRDQAWRDLDWMVQTTSAADVVSATAGVVALPQSIARGVALLEGRAAPPASRRFHSSWYPPAPQLASYARRGDVWLGRGPQIPEPFIGPAETAGEPFLQPGWGGEVVELLG